MNKALMGAILLVLTLSMLPMSSPARATVDEDREKQLYAVRVLNATRIEEGEAVKIYTIINNPETWILHNITCWFIVKPFADVEIVGMLKGSGVTTSYEAEGEEYVNITIEIEKVDMKTRFVHWVVMRFKKNGTYEVISYASKKVASLTGTRTKGEFIQKFNLTINNASITVEKAPRPYPPEGTKYAYNYIVFITIVAPLLIISAANKIVWRRRS